MPRRAGLIATGLLFVLVLARTSAAEETARAVETLAAQARKSVVVITVAGRDGKRSALGTGFVVSADGLIATNRHVIGEGQAITVEMADGSRREVTAIHAADRKLDLAILRIDARDLVPLPLGDARKLRDGQAVVAIGNPRGLRHSVVAGVVSGRRDIDGWSMIQVAIPIEPGNSGGPLLDMDGRVQGIITSKSAVTDNLGFAMPIEMLRPLLKEPHPISMSAWRTIGRLDPDDWQPRLGGKWRQRAGRIIAEGLGSGFGGRTFCLSRRKPPALPFAVSVQVRLDDEAGAAGLIFHADGEDHHYGFYPSGGKLRLTRFNGPDVFSWTILEDRASSHYRPGEWNTLEVRLDKERIRCYVNDQLVIESTDTTWTSGQVGLTKFRNTVAQFKHFRVGDKLASVASPAALARVGKLLPKEPSEKPSAALVERLTPDAAVSVTLLREQARRLEQQAARARQLAAAVHERSVHSELTRVLQGKEEEIDLIHAALLIARLDNEDVEVGFYRKEVERMADKVRAGLAKDADDKAKLAALNKFLFEERGFHGSVGDYYNRSNSYLSEVLDDREGIPITLSVLYLDLGRRLGLRVEGVGLPGHFVVRHLPAKGKPQLIDVFEGGKPMSREQAEVKVYKLTERTLRDEDLAPVKKRDIVVRILHNLLNVARAERDTPALLRYLDAILAINLDAAPERGLRAGLRAQQGDRAGAREDLDWLLEHGGDDIDAEQVRRLRRLLEEPQKGDEK